MYTFYYLALLVTTVTGAIIDDSETAIINGERASILDYPFYASLRYKVQKAVLCGGSIIQPDVVLTAAHCIGREFQVYVGISDDNDIKEAEAYDVKKIVKHPFYLGLAFFDIALVKLNRSIILSEKVEIAELATENPPEDEEVAIIGFGNPACDEFDNPLKPCTNDASDHLKYAAMTITDVTLGLISSSGQNQNACFGDSGGPMIYDGKVVGVSSQVDRKDCTGGNIYTSVASNRRWINRNLKKLAKI
ncbi:Trypsin [Oryctes borbonicus]|uniref:Trypsin n=1 Tax=Oryctes borbonicus TaxID=1629725 RepID=A0A0T6B6I6_9SCAR|nr:Trypsin [Oryctes borbonicus]